MISHAHLHAGRRIRKNIFEPADRSSRKVNMGLLRVAAMCLGLICISRGQLDLGSYENCEVLHEQLKLGWTVNQDNSTISFLLCGCRQEDLTELYVNQYVAFGLSGEADSVRMQGGDVTVAWIDAATGAANAVDYYLESYTQCREGSGVCPDVQHSGGQCTNDIVPGSVQGSREDGIQCIAFEKPFTTADSTCDLTFDPDVNQYVLWAIGGIEETAFKHFIRTEVSDVPLRLGRSPSNLCGAANFVCPICQSFSERVFDVRGQNAVFVASIGPTGGQRGYASIAGRAGWGYSWYINDTLIPHLMVSRGYTYSFISEGGDDPASPGNSRYHPFYITDSTVGGRLKNLEVQRQAETVYAGFSEDGTPVGIGPYCEYTETPAARTALDECGTFQEYLAGLSRGDTCSNASIADINREASFTWTPDDTTPNTVYYQCATHRGFGYKITVDGDSASSSPPLLHMLTAVVMQFTLILITLLLMV